MKIKLSLLLICFCCSLFSETYFLTFINNEDTIGRKILTREGKKFKETSIIGNQEIHNFFDIYCEDNRTLILTTPKEKSLKDGMIEVCILDKIKKEWGSKLVFMYNLEYDRKKGGLSLWGEYTEIK